MPADIRNLKRLHGVLEDILSLGILELLNAEKYGSYNFRDYKDLFANIVTFCKELDELPVEILPSTHVESIFQSANDLLNTLNRVVEFNPSRTNAPDADHAALIRNVNERFDDLVSKTEGDLSLLLLLRGTPKADEYQNLIKQIRAQVGEVQGIVETARNAAAEVGVTVHTGLFETQAQEHEKGARRWLKAIYVFGGVAMLFSILAIWFLPIDGDAFSPAIVQRLLLKLALLLVIFFLISQAVKNYRAHRHLTVVNKHRETSLQTFQTFVKSAEDDPQVKSQILLEAAKTIFTPSQTGYVTEENDHPVDRIIEVAKAIKGK